MKLIPIYILLITAFLTISCGSKKTTVTKPTSTNTTAKDKKFQIRTIAFYNLENLFDTINDPTKLDEKSPIMEMEASNRAKAYLAKLDNMAKVISEIGVEKANTSPAIIGVCEIENQAVLEDLIANERLKSKHYGIIHYE